MPGHIKKSDGPDPDPSPWLIVSPELKLKGLIESTEGDKVTVMILENKEVCVIERAVYRAPNKYIL